MILLSKNPEHLCKQGIHHIGRYQWASSLVSTKNRILDIACGAGYGAMMYSKQNTSAEIYGADYDKRAVQYAVEHFSAPNLNYNVGDIETWQWGDGKSMGLFDFISSFDTIEHLLHREIALMRISEALTENGILLLSTPCGHRESKLNPAWEHHKLEYSFIDLHNLMKRFFRTILYPDNGSLPNQEFWDDIINRDQTRYLNRFNPIVCKDPIKINWE